MRQNGGWGVHEAYLISVEHAPLPVMLQLREHEAIGIRIVGDNNLGAALLGGLKCELEGASALLRIRQLDRGESGVRLNLPCLC